MTSDPSSPNAERTSETAAPDGDAEPGSNPENQNARTSNAADGMSFLDRVRSFFSLKKNATLRQDLEVVLEKGDEDLTFSPEERAMLANILRLREVRADDLMVPRADIDAVDVTITLGELLFLFEESRHSRMPVYRETLDDPIGIVHVKDVMGIVMGDAEKNPNSGETSNGHFRNDVVDYNLSTVDMTQKLDAIEILRPVLFVPPSMPAPDILAKMQATRSQMALVIDEYGGTDGLLSMEDIVETVVGDIEDEHDDDNVPLIVEDGPNRWSADARVSIDEVCKTLGISLDLDAEDDDIETLGGLIFTELGRVPVRGEVVRALGGFDLEIVDADPRRIRQVRIMRAKASVKRRRGRDRSAANSNIANLGLNDSADVPTIDGKGEQ